MKPSVTREVKYYITEDESSPVWDWVQSLLPKRQIEYTKIVQRIQRAGLGNFGDHRFLDGALGELKIDQGPGYRVYFGLDGDDVILLLQGGTKDTQQQDITLAKERWGKYLEKKKKEREMKEKEESRGKGKKG